MSAVTVHHGDSREVIRSIPDCSIDAVVTDPPYALVSIVKRFGADNAAQAKSDGASGVYARASAGFMGQKWDTGETAFDPAFWAEVLRVLKPGGHLIAASGTRTYHRLACAVEDAGFEVRDMVSWLYGSGFPKSHDVSKAIDKAAGAEREITRTGRGKVAPSGKFDTQDSALRARFDRPATQQAAAWTGWGTALKPACEPWVLARKPLIGTVAANVLRHGVGALNIDGCRVNPGEFVPGGGASKRGAKGGGIYGNGEAAQNAQPHCTGRWPANVCHDGSDEVVEAFPDSAGQQGDVRGTEPSKPTNGIYGDFAGRPAQEKRGDTGSAARFFYTAKAGAEDRLGSKHPTVKPVSLMAWLCRLVTPPGGVVLDPFAGSGSTGVACIGEGFDAILIEREASFVADINRRIAWAKGEGRITAQEMARKAPDNADALPLFSGAA